MNSKEKLLKEAIECAESIHRNINEDLGGIPPGDIWLTTIHAHATVIKENLEYIAKQLNPDREERLRNAIQHAIHPMLRDPMDMNGLEHYTDKVMEAIKMDLMPEPDEFYATLAYTIDMLNRMAGTVYDTLPGLAVDAYSAARNLQQYLKK